jgi:uncharacterized membrane protein YhiD involved in acid resistance
MDPATITVIASAAVQFLVPYLQEAAKTAASEIGKSSVDAAFAKAKQAYELIKGKLQRTPEGTKAIEAISQAPEDPAAQAALQTQVQESLTADDEFAKQLSDLLKQVAATKADVSFVNNIQGEVQKLVQIGTVMGDANF